MFWRMISVVAAGLLLIQPAEAHRVALVVGQNAYVGGGAATLGLVPLANPGRDARRMAELLVQHGFEVIACDGKTPGCFDLDRSRFLTALQQLEQRASGADLALVFFAGHGMATDEGNILTSVDAKVNCATGTVSNGVLVERIMAATGPARHKLMILDACRDNPLGEVCPQLMGKKLTFTRIEAGALRGLLMVTSTQFGQEALDGPAGAHSPFASALFAALEANPGIYFEQVFNEVARATYEAAQKHGGFLQIPGKVVGGEAPADCLAGKDCIGDARMAALAVENERLTADAAGVRNLLAAEENARGKPYTAEERKARVAELEKTLASIATSTDPLRQEARRLIDVGNVAGGQAKLDEALDADEKALAEIERAAAERRKAAARNARDLAVLARGTDVVKAVAYYERAARLDASDPRIWHDYARAALDAGRTSEAKVAFEQAALKARGGNNPQFWYWATLGLGDVEQAQGNIAGARSLYETAVAIAEPIAKTDPSDAGWQRDISVSYERIGNVLLRQGKLTDALVWFRNSLAARERLAKLDPHNTAWQRDLSVSYENIGEVLVAQGNNAEALKPFRDSLDIRDRLGKSDPNNANWQRDLSTIYFKIAEALRAAGQPNEALDWLRKDLAIAERLAMRDPGRIQSRRDLVASYDRLGSLHAELGNSTAALETYGKGLAMAEQTIATDPNRPDWQRDRAATLENMGKLLVLQGSDQKALARYREAILVRDRLARAAAPHPAWQREREAAYRRVSQLLLAMRHMSESFAAAEQYVAVTRLAAEEDTDKAQRVASALGTLSWTGIITKNFDKSVAAAREAVSLAGDTPGMTWLKINLAHGLMLSGEVDEARSFYLAVLSVGGEDGQKWRSSIRGDFKELRDQGLERPLMGDIERLLSG
jgi:tetratricopeptide (TPR) repeat protein